MNYSNRICYGEAPPLHSKPIQTYLTERQLFKVTLHYCIAALWADEEEGTHPRISLKEFEKAREECQAFIEQCENNGQLFTKAMACFNDGYGWHHDAGSAEAAFGHDFWLTRQGHGVGFWDREGEGLPSELGDALTEQAKAFGEDHGHYQYRGWWYFGN